MNGYGTCILYAGGYDTFHDFPDRDPGVSLLQALDSVRGQVVTAKQILATPVLWSNVQYKTPRVVWAITLRGVLPEMPREGMSREAIYQYRLIVDAKTGEYLCGGSSPQPDEDIQKYAPPKPGS